MSIVFLVTGASAQTVARIQMDFEGPVELVVTDSQGERSGYNPITKEDYDEIPYAGYGDGSKGEREFAFHSALKDTSFSTTYMITIFGIGTGMFEGYGGGKQTWSKPGESFRLIGVIDSNQTATYAFSYSTDSTITPTFAKVIDSNTIRPRRIGSPQAQSYYEPWDSQLVGEEGSQRLDAKEQGRDKGRE